MISCSKVFTFVFDCTSADKLFHNLWSKWKRAFWPWMILVYRNCSLYSDLRLLCLWLNAWQTSDMYVGDMFLKNSKIFTQKYCSNLALVGSQFTFQNSSIWMWALFSSFKHNLMHLFWEIRIFLAKRLLRFGHHAEHV